MTAYRVRIALLALSLLAGAGVSSAYGQEDAAAEVVETCKSKLTRVGRPNTLEMIASLNAVAAWTDAARKVGTAYANWSKADGGAVSCEKKSGSRFYVCYASGKPCFFKQAVKNESRSQAVEKSQSLDEIFGRN